jgi:hypothetical protein
MHRYKLFKVCYNCTQLHVTGHAIGYLANIKPADKLTDQTHASAKAKRGAPHLDFSLCAVHYFARTHPYLN